jgi:hypothetical protein
MAAVPSAAGAMVGKESGRSSPPLFSGYTGDNIASMTRPRQARCRFHLACITDWNMRSAYGARSGRRVSGAGNAEATISSKSPATVHRSRHRLPHRSACRRATLNPGARASLPLCSHDGNALRGKSAPPARTHGAVWIPTGGREPIVRGSGPGGCGSFPGSDHPATPSRLTRTRVGSPRTPFSTP